MRRVAVVVAVLAAPAFVLIAFDGLVSGGDSASLRPTLVETLARAAHGIDAVIRGSGPRLHGTGVGAVAAPVLPTNSVDASPPIGQAAAPTAPARLDVPILVYHNIRATDVGVKPAEEDYYVTLDQLDAQFAHLEKNGYAAVSFDDLNAAFDGGAPLPAKPVIISFDDDRESQFVDAFPLLVRHHLTATFFVFTNAIGRSGYFSWDQLRTLMDAGMSVEGHSTSHPFLTKLDDEALRKELVDSKALLEKRLGITVTTFAYPFGLYDGRVVAAVRAAGYAMARGLGHRVRIANGGRLTLPGYVTTGDLAAFKEILAGTRR